MAKELHFPLKEGRLFWAGRNLVVFECSQSPLIVLCVVLNLPLIRLSIRSKNDVVNVWMCVGDVAEYTLHHSLKLGTRILHT